MSDDPAANSPAEPDPITSLSDASTNLALPELSTATTSIITIYSLALASVLLVPLIFTIPVSTFNSMRSDLFDRKMTSLMTARRIALENRTKFRDSEQAFRALLAPDTTASGIVLAGKDRRDVGEQLIEIGLRLDEGAVLLRSGVDIAEDLDATETERFKELLSCARQRYDDVLHTIDEMNDCATSPSTCPIWDEGKARPPGLPLSVIQVGPQLENIVAELGQIIDLSPRMPPLERLSALLKTCVVACGIEAPREQPACTLASPGLEP